MSPIMGLNALPLGVRERLYVRLIPEELLVRFAVDPQRLEGPGGQRLLRVTASEDKPWARVELRAREQDRDPVLLVDIGESVFGPPELALVQINDPFLPDIFVEPGLDDKQMRRRAQIYAEAVNNALKGIPRERVRFHTCYGINEGPRLYEATLAQIIEYVLSINAGSYSFEAANPRHEHEYHLFERVKIPEGTVLCPGVITHASNIVEHPELIAERLIRFANLVGRENVMAGGDCGFSSQALYRTEVHDTVVWEKFKAMRAGADIATKKLWN